MDCTRCDNRLPLHARFCPACGAQVTLWTELESNGLPPRIAESAPADPAHSGLRGKLTEGYLNVSMSMVLSEWLRDLGLPPTGTTQEKLSRLRQQAGSLILPAESFARQTIYYLNRYEQDVLVEICEELGLDGSGDKEQLLTRIYGEVGIREGWLDPLSEDARLMIADTLLPLLLTVDPGTDSSLDLREESSDTVGLNSPRFPLSQAYGRALMTVLIPGLLQEAHASMLQRELDARTGKPP